MNKTEKMSKDALIIIGSTSLAGLCMGGITYFFTSFSFVDSVVLGSFSGTLAGILIVFLTLIFALVYKNVIRRK